MKKCKRILSYFLVMLMILQSTMITAFADTVDVSSGSNAGNTDTSFVASAEMLGGGLVVIIPDEIPLTYEDSVQAYTNDSSVIAKGYVDVGKYLEVSVLTDVTYTHDILSIITADGTVTFGNTNGAYQITEWSQTELKTKDDSNTVVGVTKPLNVSVPKANIMDIGTYSSVIDFYINLLDGEGSGDDETPTETVAYVLGYDYVTTPTYTENDDSIPYDEYFTSSDTVAELKAFRVVEDYSTDNPMIVTLTMQELKNEGYDYVTWSTSTDLSVPSTVYDSDTDTNVSVVGVSFKEFFNDSTISKYVKTVTLPSSVEGIELAEDTSSDATTVITSYSERVLVNLSKILPNLASIKFVNEDNTSGGDDIIIGGEEDDDTVVDDEYVIYELYTWDTTTIPGEAILTGLNETSMLVWDGSDFVSYREMLGNDIIIPSEYNGLPVTTIADGAFALSNYNIQTTENITSITIPDSVTTIGSCKGFDDYSDLTSYNCIDNCNHKGVFEGLVNLQTITMSDNVTFLGAYAFKDCSNLSNVTLSDNIKNIYAYTFYNCNSLVNIDLPKNLEYVGQWVFFYTSVVSVTLPTSIERIGARAFYCNGMLTRDELQVSYDAYTYTSMDDLVLELCMDGVYIALEQGHTPFKYLGSFLYEQFELSDYDSYFDYLINVHHITFESYFANDGYYYGYISVNRSN